ncbi:MAG: hypothetical protein WCD18_26320 [Thermosynechococcaceae cyanobacterium]
MTAATAPPLSWYESSEDAKRLLIAASQTWENTAASEQFMLQALAQPEPALDVLVSAYRFFFYKNNNSMALQMAQQVMARVKATEGLPDDWTQLQPLLTARKEEPNIRLYLNAYAASGFVLARLGQTEDALAIASRVKSLDDRNEFGARTVLDILTRPADDDD